MARYGSEHKQATRQRIIETSARRLKRDGIDGAGVATLMADAGLLGAQAGGFGAQPPGAAGVEQIVREYLSVGHRDHREEGCPSAALLDEIGRCSDTTKQAFTGGVLAVVEDIAARLSPEDPETARLQALSVYAAMVGTLQLSRALSDQVLSDALLEQGVRNALTLLGIAQQV